MDVMSHDVTTSAVSLSPICTSLPEQEPVSSALDIAEDSEIIAIRPLHLHDIDQVRKLHEEWFPIRYQQGFYDGAAHGVWRETGHPLFSRVAIQISATAQSQVTASPSFTKCELIVGAVMASTIPLATVDDSDLIDCNDTVHTHGMYILTLGSHSSVRRRGIASSMLRECIEEAQRQPHCGVVYLHVKADNTKALQFYEKNGFKNLRFLKDYYLIDNVRHSAYLYIRYVNGAFHEPPGWFQLFTKPLYKMFAIVKAWIDTVADGEQEYLDDEQEAQSNVVRPLDQNDLKCIDEHQIDVQLDGNLECGQQQINPLPV